MYQGSEETPFSHHGTRSIVALLFQSPENWRWRSWLAAHGPDHWVGLNVDANNLGQSTATHGKLDTLSIPHQARRWAHARPCLGSARKLPDKRFFAQQLGANRGATRGFPTREALHHAAFYMMLRRDSLNQVRVQFVCRFVY